MLKIFTSAMIISTLIPINNVDAERHSQPLQENSTSTNSTVLITSAIQQKGFSFKFQKCLRAASEEIKCTIWVENLQGATSQIDFRGGRLFDDLGNVTEGTFWLSNDSTNMQLPPNIPVTASATFQGISRNASLVMLEVKFWDTRKTNIRVRDSSVQFRLN